MSSNRTVAKLIEGIIGEENERRAKEGVGHGGRGREGTGNEDTDVIQGPKIWLCSTARSLVGKEKRRRG